jgi:hypothetical protein
MRRPAGTACGTYSAIARRLLGRLIYPGGDRSLGVDASKLTKAGASPETKADVRAARLQTIFGADAFSMHPQQKEHRSGSLTGIQTQEVAVITFQAALVMKNGFYRPIICARLPHPWQPMQGRFFFGAVMYADTIDKFSKAGAHKVSLIGRSPLAFLIGAAMAGASIGFGDILMFSVGSHVDPAYVHLIMGGAFACALTIVVFAGSDLFTGTAMYMPFAVFPR